MKDVTFDLETFLPYRLSVASAEVSQRFANHYRESHDLDRAEWRIICHLSQYADEESVSVRELEKRAHLEKSKVSRAVKRLEGRGYVRKMPNKGDARLIEISLTPEGEQLFKELVPLANTFQASLVEKLTQAEAEQLINTLKKLAK